MKTYEASCHCGRVVVRVRADDSLRVVECNCSMCSRLSYLHLIVPAQDLELVSGHDALTHYRFGTRTADHTFCKICGIKVFYVPRSHPDGFSVNVRCMDAGARAAIGHVESFDGAHFEEHIAELAPLPAPKASD